MSVYGDLGPGVVIPNPEDDIEDEDEEECDDCGEYLEDCTCEES